MEPPRMVKVNGDNLHVSSCATATTFSDGGHGLRALRVLTIETVTTRYEGAFLLDPTAGDYGKRDREQTADNVTAIEYPLPDHPCWPRVVFRDGSETAAFLAPEPLRADGLAARV